MSKHTPGTAEVVEDRRGIERIYIGDWEALRALSTHGSRRLSKAEHRANRFRIAACWNACAGIPTSSLSEGCFAKLLKLLAERQEDFCQSNCYQLDEDHWEECDEMRAALTPFTKEGS